VTSTHARLADQFVTLRDVLDRVRAALQAEGIATGEPADTIIVTGQRIAVLPGDERTDLSEADGWTLIRVWPQDDPALVTEVVKRAIEAERRHH
jgi:hypothetical protein